MHRTDSWDDLRFFLAVAETGSLSAAARSLAVNQSTVFRRIQQLETALGARLFDRLPRGYALTSTGEAMLPRARQIEDDVLAMRRAVSGADQGLHGEIRLTTVLELLDTVGPALASFQTAYPGITLRISTDPRVLRLGRHEADMALRPGLAPTEPDVIGRRLRPLGVGVYASTAYLARHGRPATLDDATEPLSPHTVIGFEQISDAPDAGLKGRTSITADHKSAQASLCRAGLGLAALPRFVGDPDPTLERLFELPVADIHLWLLIHMDLRRTARVRALADHLTEVLSGAEAGESHA